ncbi:hypothetical protein BASA82_000474 [Batrachochytrium salamandrivorans]|nr:hypothetical protein BASA82_000474 [Batrachochytrium salamandrivorans]
MRFASSIGGGEGTLTKFYSEKHEGLIRSTKGLQSIFPVTTTTSTTAMDKKDTEEGEEDAEEEDTSIASKLCHLDDVFQVNPNWTSKRSRLKINQIQIKETKKENDDAHKRVQGDRQYQIDAAIVRIMKSRSNSLTRYW